MTFRSNRLLVACRQLPCQLCGAEDGTVVAAHGNSSADGKGMGHKASDAAVAALCFKCHAEIDQGSELSKDERRARWYQAHVQTLRALIERGILRVA